MRILRSSYALIPFALVFLALTASPALAGEAHPPIEHTGFETDTFSNPNGIAVDESTGDVYVADIATGTVSRFDANGNPVDFSSLHSNELSGAGTPAGSFSFPNVYGTPAAVAVDNSTELGDPSRGDLYVMDAGHGAIDKFSPGGEYLSQIAGPFEGELLGLALTANGSLRVEAGSFRKDVAGGIVLFDNAAANNFISQLKLLEPPDISVSATPSQHSFAVGPTGTDFTLFECGCVEEFGSNSTYMDGLGRVDNGPGDIAMAVDPVSGHLYVDAQSSVAEWDTGGVDGYTSRSLEDEGSGALVSSFGSLQLSGASAQQGGIAVNGANGEIYVSSPATGKVYVFASATPAVAAGTATHITQTDATLQGSVDPRGAAVTSCVFEYEKARHGQEELEFTAPITFFAHSAPCAQSATQIGSGAGPVDVSAEIGGLEAGVLYVFRLVAGNAGGTSPSEGLFAAKSAGFGVKGLSVTFLNQDGTPDTQAGSHPYEMVTSFTFNRQAEQHFANMQSPYQLAPVGNAKDIVFTPPPGLIGNPSATEAKCTISELSIEGGHGACPAGSQVGVLYVETTAYGTGNYPLYNMVPPHGVAAQFGTQVIAPNAFIDVGLQAGGQYPVQAESLDIPAIEPVLRLRTTLYGVVGSNGTRRSFLTLPTGCTGPLHSSVTVDSYQHPGQFVTTEEVTRNSAGEPVVLGGCSKLTFPAAISAVPDVPNASSASGLSVGVHTPQTGLFNPEGLAESALRNTTVALPAGVAINPAGADGLEACSTGLAGFTGFKEFNPEFEPGAKWATFTQTPIEALRPGVSLCPDQSKIGTVKIKTPLLPNPLEGAVYVATQNANPFASLIAMYMMFEDPVSGSTVKLAGEVRLCETTGEVISGVSCQAPGQIIATFDNTPDLPFEDLELHFFGGERAPLSTPSRCGTYTTQAIFTPWDGNAPVKTSSSFQITSGPNGTPCPGQSLPFEPTLTGGTTSNQAGGVSPFTMTMSRADGQQNLQSVSLHMPAGLSGLLAGIELCGEAQANAGTCGPSSLIGETTVSVGVGSDPFSVKGGKVYLTGPYKGAPFGLSIINPAKAGPYDVEHDTSKPGLYTPACDCIVVRAKIEVNPVTAELTVTSDNEGPYKIPTMLDGIPLEIQHVSVTINRPGFTFNPTNCEPLSISGSLYSAEGGVDTVSLPFQATNCAALGFAPKFAVSTSGKASRVDGTSLNVKLTYPNAPFGSQANIKQVKVELPKLLPSRLPTLQKACTAAQFNSNPAGCPAASIIGHAKAISPLVPVPLEGPAYFVSNGGEAFPNLIVVLQGYNVRIDLVGDTFISKAGVTSSTFKTVPDAPVGSFELNLPAGPYSALTTAGNLCTAKTLTMPTEFIAQNGAELKQATKIAVTGCPKAKKTAHKKKHKAKHKRKQHKKGGRK